MIDESRSNAYAPYPYASGLPAPAGSSPTNEAPSGNPANQQDFDIMKRAYEGNSSGSGMDKKPRFNAYGPNRGNSTNTNNGYGDPYANGMNSGFPQAASGYMGNMGSYDAFQGMGGANAGMSGYGSQSTSPYMGSPSANPATFNMGSGGAANNQNGASQNYGSPASGYSAYNNNYNAGFSSPALSQAAISNAPYGNGANGTNGMGMGLLSPQTAGLNNPMQMQQAAAMAVGMSNMGSMMGNGMNLGSPGSGGMGQTGRTVYVGNLPADASVDELLNLVRFGPIDNVKILPEKNCAFVSFLDPVTAAAFHSDALMRKLRLHDQELKIGWGKPSAVPANVVMAVQQSGATRNVYLGNLDENMSEQQLRDDLQRFGPIDQVKIVRDKNIGFVHFLSIATAIKVVQTLTQEPAWAGRRVNYGKDRCAYVPKNQHQQQQHNMAAAALAANATGYGYAAGYNATSPMTGTFGFNAIDPAQAGNRTVYLGNIHPETTTEEICNTIRGGILQQVRYIPDKHICFVTFVDPNAAIAFYHMASFQGIALHNRRLKVGWGKHSGPPSPGIAMVVQSGGSRNIYIGNIDDFDTYTEEKIRTDFGAYGEIELVNLLKEKNCAFCNFTNIAHAIKAIEGMKQHEDYSKLKIAYGKDRCGNPPRSIGFGHGGMRRGFSGDGEGGVEQFDGANYEGNPEIEGDDSNERLVKIEKAEEYE